MTQQKRGFEWTLELYDKATGALLEATPPTKNLIPQQGWDFLIPAAFGDVAPIGSFYCGLYTSDYAPVDGVKAADLPGLGEFTGYAEATRPRWERVYAGNGIMSNATNKAIITPTQDARVYGMFLVSAAEKGSGSGTLLSIVRFPTAKDLAVGVEAKLVATANFANRD